MPLTSQDHSTTHHSKQRPTWRDAASRPDMDPYPQNLARWVRWEDDAHLIARARGLDAKYESMVSGWYREEDAAAQKRIWGAMEKVWRKKERVAQQIDRRCEKRRAEESQKNNRRTTQPIRIRTASRARRSPACIRRAEADSGGADPDPEPERPLPSPSPAPESRGATNRKKKYVRTLAGSIDDPRVTARRVDEDDDYIYSRGPRRQSIVKISPQIIGKFAENGWARCQREADFYLRIANGGSVARAARAVGVGRTTGYNWLHRAHAQIVAAGQPDGSGVRAAEISGHAWQPARRGRRRTRLISRQPRVLRVRHLLHEQMDLLTGGAS